jgi:hypothetical protein
MRTLAYLGDYCGQTVAYVHEGDNQIPWVSITATQVACGNDLSGRCALKFEGGRTVINLLNATDFG